MLKEILCSALTLAAIGLYADKFTIDTDRPEALYKCGETAVFTVKAADDNGNLLTSGTATIHLRKEKQQNLAEYTMDFAKNNPATYQITLDEPGFVWLTVNNADNVYYPSPIAAAGFDAEKIVPTTIDPQDFDQFWADGLAKVQAIPLDAQVTKMEEFSDDEFDGYRLSFANINDTRIYGFMAVPKNAAGPLPVLISVPGAGPGATGPDLYFFRNPKLITIIMNVHDYDPRPETLKENFADLGRRGGNKAYAYHGAPDREAYFYRRAILGVNRVFEFLDTFDGWDHENLAVWGSSQGGAYAIILSALNPDKVDFAASNVPAMCEHTAHQVGRSSGWPLLLQNTPDGTEAMAPYFDVVNFARRVKTPIMVAVGLIDVACGPSCVYAAYNTIPATDKLIWPMPKKGHDFDDKFLDAIRSKMYKTLNIE